MKSSKEFKSMPRRVTPAEFMEVSAPHNFSLGECRLRMMIEFGSNDRLPSSAECAKTQSNVIPFTANRGAPRAEESLFSSVLNEEGSLSRKRARDDAVNCFFRGLL